MRWPRRWGWSLRPSTDCQEKSEKNGKEHCTDHGSFSRVLARKYIVLAPEASPAHRISDNPLRASILPKYGTEFRRGRRWVQENGEN